MLDFVGSRRWRSRATRRGSSRSSTTSSPSSTAIVEHFGCDRMKTMGDAYMAVAGIPEADVDHADSLARTAIACAAPSRSAQRLARRAVALPHRDPVRTGHRLHRRRPEVRLRRLRAGRHLASPLEELADPVQILVSADTRELIKDEFDLTELGAFELKGLASEHRRCTRSSARARAPDAEPREREERRAWRRSSSRRAERGAPERASS